MIALHGIWSAAEQLYLWAENGEAVAPAPKPKGRPARVPKPRPHPYAMEPEALAGCLAGAGVNASGAGQVGSINLLLPTAPFGPLPSPELLAREDLPAAPSTALAPWELPALVFDGRSIIDVLAGLQSALGARRDVVPGQSLRFWIQVANLSLATMAAGQVLPALVAGPGGTVAGRWRPVLATPEAREQVATLAQSMPPVCRAEVPSESPSRGGQTPRKIVESMLGCLVDACARQAMAETQPRRSGRKGGAGAAWVRALGAPDPTAPVPAGQAAAFGALSKRIEAWSRPARAPATSALRTCFRLTAPDTDPEDAAVTPHWRLEFLLQSMEDRSALVPASQIWGGGGGHPWAGSDPAATEHPEETLLAGLGRASRLYPGLQAALRTARPSSYELGTGEAYDFLAHAAPVLQQAGFGVLIPPWWSKRSARLGVRLTVRPKGQSAVAGRSLVGVDGICDYQWQVAVGDEALSEAELLRLASLKEPLVKLRGRWVELRTDEVAAALRFFQKGNGHGEMRLADALALGLGATTGDGGLPVVGVVAEGVLGDLLQAGAPARYREVAVPKSLAGTLRPYQRRGLSWLAFHDALGLGACLADDMGLGKTIQLLSLLVTERQGRRRGRPAPTLLVCPMSLVSNWEREASRFAPSLRVHVHHGTERLAGEEFAEAAASADLVLTTYALAARDQERLAGVGWGRVVLDEAQNIKNRGARQSQAVAGIPAARRVALTGTPVENRLSDLWSIMNFLNPGLLGDAAGFRRRFAVPVERFGDEEAAERLRRLTGPFILRRLKTDRAIIADLPDKVEMKVFCNLTREQATLYQAVVDDMLRRIDSSEGIERKGLVLATMTKLKQVCNHPAHLLGDRSPLPGRSGKLSRLEEILEEILTSGERALCFTQFAEMGELLRRHLRQHLAMEVAFLHGGVAKKARDEMVTRFQSGGGPPIFVLSLKAGGTGLNLTAANHVIHFDRWWNPAVENQATDRAFRIGQRRNVQVRKFLCAGTLEERIDQMIEQKQALAERIVGTGEAWLTELSTDQLRDLIALDAGAVSEG